jgi:teichuronic acid biosynthesis glycosyltransferase TuaC
LRVARRDRGGTTDMRLNVLALSYLFPNRAQPAYGVFVLNRLKALQAHCNVIVIAPIQWYPLISRIRGRLHGQGVPGADRIGGIEVHHPRFPVIPRYFKWIDAVSYWWAAHRVARRLRDDGGFAYDLVDVHWTYPDIVAGYLIARHARKKFIVTVRGHEALYDEERSLRRWLVAHFLRKADFVVTLSEELRDKVIALGVSPERARVVLNGVDLAHFHPRDRQACRQQLRLPAGRRILVSVGRITEGKGHQDLIRMMSELSATDAVELYIIGGVNPEDDFSARLRAMIAELKLSNVHLIDKVSHDELPHWYAAADLFCLATRREGCPNVLLEALACGTPVVVTNVGAVGELVTPGQNGLLVELSELSSMSTTVHSALGRNWDHAGIAARMQAWGWSACAENVLGVFRTVLESES